MPGWNIRGPFQLIREPTKHYVIQLSNAGKTEINIPKNISNKRAAAAWLRAHPANVARARFKPRGKPKRKESTVNLFKYRWRPEPRQVSPNVPGVMPWYTQERKNFMKYLARLPPSNSPKYGPESPMMRRLRRAAYKSEGQPVSPSPVKNKFTCSAGKTMRVIGKGRQGVIYKGDGFVAKVCPRDLGAASRGERQPAIIEFEIQQEIFKACPEGVVEVYKHEKCLNFVAPSAINMENVQNPARYDKSKQSIIFMEYCSGGSLSKWLDSRAQTDASLHRIITSVLKTLNKIKIKFPEFRHNDLHLENVFVTSRGFLIGDFGWSRLKKHGTNPAVNTANKSGTAGAWGIGPNTDARYDHHCFLNNLRVWVSRKGSFPAVLSFLDEAVPAGYRGASDTHVKEWRLKYDDPCPGLPTVEELLKNKFITGKKFSSPNLLAAKARLRKVLVPGRMKRTRPVSRPRLRSANLRAARNALKPLGPRGRVTSAQIMAARRKLKARQPTKKRITAAMMKNKRFDKIVEYYWILNGRKSGPNYDNAWNLARTKAVRLVERRMNNGNAPFSPVRGNSVKRSVVKRANISVPVPRAPSPPKVNAAKLANAAARLRAKSNALKAARAKIVVLGNSEKSPSGRIKIKNPQTGRLVYANGPTISLSYLKNLATRRGVNIRGLRAKDAIAKKIFG